jgi:hypothetical protein
MSEYTDYDTTSIVSILSSDSIVDTLDAINTNYSMLHLGVSTIEMSYNKKLQPIIDFYNLYASGLHESLTLYTESYNKWSQYVTTVQGNSAKWLQPFSIYYPTLIQDPFTDDDINTINNWIRKYFPIKNKDGTLNYVEGQKFLVNCFTYDYVSPDGFSNGILTDSPYSYCECNTYSGGVYLHCQTLIGGGWVACSNATYYCNKTIDCYPSQNVDCWYTTPYTHLDGTIITDTGNEFNKNDPKQKVRSQINANITMEFTDRRETSIKTLLFVVSNCDWAYTESTYII